LTNITLMSETRIEHEEFVQNEAVIEIIETMLDKVEANHEPKSNNVGVFISPLKVSKVNIGCQVAVNNESDDEDEYVSACSKRQMNESIMSLDDSTIRDNKKLKNQTLNDSIKEGNDVISNVSFSLF